VTDGFLSAGDGLVFSAACASAGDS